MAMDATNRRRADESAEALYEEGMEAGFLAARRADAPRPATCWLDYPQSRSSRRRQRLRQRDLLQRLRLRRRPYPARG